MRKVTVPKQSSVTVLQALRALLAQDVVTLATLSRDLGLPEKQVTSYLAELNKLGQLIIYPAECGKCGFRFTGRKKVHKPSKCPKCKGTYIAEPEYKLKGRNPLTV